MTRMLLRIADAHEAALAQAAQVDAVEFAMGTSAGDLETAQAVRGAFAGTLRLRFANSSLERGLLDAATAARANEIALPINGRADATTLPDRPHGLSVVAIVPAEGNLQDAAPRLRDRAGAAMLDAGPDARLIDRTAIAQIDAFALACRANGLSFGLSGRLEAPDVARLLLLKPDVLGFDNAVRQGHRRDGQIDPLAIEAIRALIPRDGAAPGPVHQHRIEVTDRIFVRDFVVPLAIGAYQAEHGSRQRVRFSVSADVRRQPVPPHDMRDVFSYDVIIETIRVLAERSHVTFVETLAEEVAASLLTHPDLTGVSVKVEKLDVIEGIVGIEIARRRVP